jgi:hypothetical protein
MKLGGQIKVVDGCVANVSNGNGCMPIPVAARSKAWVCDRSLAGIVGSNPAGGKDVCLL